MILQISSVHSLQVIDCAERALHSLLSMKWAPLYSGTHKEINNTVTYCLLFTELGFVNTAVFRHNLILPTCNLYPSRQKVLSCRMAPCVVQSLLTNCILEQTGVQPQPLSVLHICRDAGIPSCWRLGWAQQLLHQSRKYRYPGHYVVYNGKSICCVMPYVLLAHKQIHIIHACWQSIILSKFLASMRESSISGVLLRLLCLTCGRLLQCERTKLCFRIRHSFSAHPNFLRFRHFGNLVAVWYAISLDTTLGINPNEVIPCIMLMMTLITNLPGRRSRRVTNRWVSGSKSMFTVLSQPKSKPAICKNNKNLSETSLVCTVMQNKLR